MLSFLTCIPFSFSLALVFVHRIAVRILPPLRLLEWVGVVGNSSSCFLNDKLSLRLCPVAAGEDCVGIGEELPILVGEDRGVEDAIVPSMPALDVTEEDLCKRVTGWFLAATAIAGLCGEPIAITKGILVLDVPLTLRSVLDDDDCRLLLNALDPDPTRE